MQDYGAGIYGKALYGKYTVKESAANVSGQSTAGGLLTRIAVAVAAIPGVSAVLALLNATFALASSFDSRSTASASGLDSRLFYVPADEDSSVVWTPDTETTDIWTLVPDSTSTWTDVNG